MTSDLGTTQDPRRLLPGDVGAVVRVMRDLRELGDSAETAGKNLARIETEQGWRGGAAESFRARFADEPLRWREAGEAFHRAASALDGYAATLQWGQGQAQLAAQLWSQGEASPMSPAAAGAGRAALAVAQGSGPGEAYRGHARQVLAEAREKVRRSGDLAQRSVVDAMATAPKAPGFWARVRGYAGAVKDGALDVGAETVNGLASFGNAAVRHPEDVAAAAAGLSLMSAGSGGRAAGVALDATAVGAVAGVPLNVASAAAITAGSAVAGTAVSDLVHHATGDNRVSPVTRHRRSTSRADGGAPTDR